MTIMFTRINDATVYTFGVFPSDLAEKIVVALAGRADVRQVWIDKI